MNASAEPDGAEADAAADGIKTKAVAALHLASMRRQFAAIREIYGADAPHRAREALWVALEVVQAELSGEPIALRDLVARAGGLLSAPTLSRVAAELEQRGILASEQTASPKGRLKSLRPTPWAVSFLAARADTAFAEFAAIVREAEQR
jgi:hypothetical protein